MRSEITPKTQTDPAEAVIDSCAADGLALFPTSVIALGSPAPPIERLAALQSAAAKAVDLLTTPRFFRPGLSLPAWLRLRAQ